MKKCRGPNNPHFFIVSCAFLIIYGPTFFFSELGPNATTFVHPSEIFPLSVRTTGHGIAAVVGKRGVFVFPNLLVWKGLLGAK